MCGKRLWDWKTMPLRARNALTARRYAPLSVGGSEKSTLASLIRTTPASGVSSTLSERSTVVLPDPDGPSRTVTVPASAAKSTPLQDQLVAERLLQPAYVDQVGHVAYLLSRRSSGPWARVMR